MYHMRLEHSISPVSIRAGPIHPSVSFSPFST